MKEVFRRPGQDLPAASLGGDHWVDSDCPAMLYKLEEINGTETFVIVEGERDADTINGFEFEDRNGRTIVATTSGGVSSWKDELADNLIGKNVIVMVDSDQPGKSMNH